MIWVRRVVMVLFGAILVWGLLLFATRGPQVHYRLFIFLLLPALIVVLRFPLESLREPRAFLLVVVGLFLLVPIILQPTVNGNGFVIASLGWLAFSLTVGATHGGEGRSRSILLFLILLGGVEALYGFIQYLGGVEYLYEAYRGMGPHASGSYNNHNHFAGLLNMTIPLAIGGLFANYSSLKERLRSEVYGRAWVILLSCAFMGLGILLSLSRGGTLTLIATLVLISILLTIGRQGRGRRKLSGTAAWMMLFTTLGLGAWVGMESLLGRFEQIGEGSRPALYQDTLGLIADHPIAGVGPGMYQWRFRPYQRVDLHLRYDQAHNDYLQFAAEWGIPVALLFWGFVVWRFWRSIRVFLEFNDPWQQGIALGCAGAIFSILVHSLVDFNLQIPVNLMIFCVILALSYPVSQMTRIRNTE